MSLYMHREAYKKNITYSQWVDESVQMHKKWDMCRKKVLDKIVPPRYKNEVRSTYLVDELLIVESSHPSSPIGLRSKCPKLVASRLPIFDPETCSRSSSIIETYFVGQDMWVKNEFCASATKRRNEHRVQ